MFPYVAADAWWVLVWTGTLSTRGGGTLKWMKCVLKNKHAKKKLKKVIPWGEIALRLLAGSAREISSG